MEVTVKPSVGRIVHYVSYGTKNGEYSPECRAGIVTEVGQWVTIEESFTEGEDNARIRVLRQEFHPEACSLSVHNPTGVFFNSGGVPIEHDEDTKKPGSWHWPERVDG